jgi:hypothetical protein
LVIPRRLLWSLPSDPNREACLDDPANGPFRVLPAKILASLSPSGSRTTLQLHSIARRVYHLGNSQPSSSSGSMSANESSSSLTSRGRDIGGGVSRMSTVRSTSLEEQSNDDDDDGDDVGGNGSDEIDSDDSDDDDSADEVLYELTEGFDDDDDDIQEGSKGIRQTRYLKRASFKRLDAFRERRSTLLELVPNSNKTMSITALENYEEYFNIMHAIRQKNEGSSCHILYHYTNPTFANSILTNGLKMSTQVERLLSLNSRK